MLHWCVLLTLSFLHASLSLPCDLQCWLHNLTLSIPDHTFHNGSLAATLSQFRCTAITIGSIQSGAVAPFGAAVDAADVGLACSTQWSLSAFSVHIDSGSASVSIAHSTFGATLALQLGQNGTLPLPSSAALPRCQAAFHANIHFDCGILCRIADAFKSLIDPFLDKQLNSNICAQLSALVAVNGTAALRQLNAMVVEPVLRSPQPPALPLVAHDSVLLQNNSVVQLLDYVLDDLVGVSGPLNINKIIDRFTNSTGAVALNSTVLQHYLGEDAKMEFRFAELGNVTVALLGLNASGLASWSQFDVLRPIGSFELESRTAMDALSIDVDFELTVNTNGTGMVRAGTLTERASVHVKLSQCELLASTTVSLSNDAVQRLQLPDQAMDINCVMSTVYAVAVNRLALNATIDELTLTAHDGAGLEKDFDHFIDVVVETILSAYADALPSLLTGFVATPLRNMANSELHRVLTAYHQNQTCVSVDLVSADQPLYMHLGTRIALLGAVSLISCILILMCVAHVRRRRAVVAEAAAKGDGGDSEPLLLAVVEDDIEELDALAQSSLAMHPQLHCCVRVGVPLVVVLTIALFVSSNTSVGAAVVPVVTLGEKVVRPAPLFEFSLVNSVRDMWHAKVYALSLLIAVLSGAWVYAKLLLMLLAWFVPPTWLREARRHTLLSLLDLLGKWSLIDAFVLVLMLVAFRFRLAVPHSNAAIDVYVVPNFGFYSFLGATMLSLALTHFIVAMHRRAVAPAPASAVPLLVNQRSVNVAAAADNDDDDDELHDTHGTLWRSVRSRQQRRGDVRTVCTGGGQLVLLAALLASAALICAAVASPSFMFVFGGAAGLAMRTLDGSSELKFSMLSLGQTISTVGMPGTEQGMRYLQGSFYALAIGVPLAHLLLLLLLWLVPLRRTAARRVYFFAEVLHAWSALDVFGVSLICALLEIGQFASFIIGTRCDELNALLREYFDEALHGDDVCFSVETRLLRGCWMLLGAFVVNLLVGAAVMRLTHAALLADEDEAAADKARRQTSNRGSTGTAGVWTRAACHMGLMRRLTTSSRE